MKQLSTLIIICALAACGGKSKTSSTTPKTDPNAGSMGGASYGKPAGGGTAPAPTPPTTGGTATPNPCGAGI